MRAHFGMPLNEALGSCCVMRNMLRSKNDQVFPAQGTPSVL